MAALTDPLPDKLLLYRGLALQLDSPGQVRFENRYAFSFLGVHDGWIDWIDAILEAMQNLLDV